MFVKGSFYDVCEGGVLEVAFIFLVNVWKFYFFSIKLLLIYCTRFL